MVVEETSAAAIDQDAFVALVEETLAGVSGTAGIMARDLTTGRELAYNAGEIFPTASTLKVPLLYELYRQVDAGDIDLTRRVPIRAEQRVPGSGVLRDLDPGLAPTIRDLAELMIVVSDNFATDLLYGIVGKERLAATLADLGLRQTAIPFPCRGIFCALTGMAPDDPATTYEALAAALEAGRRSPESIAYAADDRNDTSTPADMVKLLTLIEQGRGLTPTSRAAVIDTLRRQKYNTVIPFRLPEGTKVAHKTGSLKGIRNDVGLVYAPTGPYAIALMSKGIDDAATAGLRLADISFIVWRAFTSVEP